MLHGRIPNKLSAVQVVKSDGKPVATKCKRLEVAARHVMLVLVSCQRYAPLGLTHDLIRAAKRLRYGRTVNPSFA